VTIDDLGQRAPPAMVRDARRALVIAAALGGATAILFVLVWFPSTRQVVQDVDDAFQSLMHALRWDPMVTVAKVLSVASGAWGNWTVRIAVVVVLARRGHWVHLAAFALAIATSEALIGPMKVLYDRPRPAAALIETTGAAFPSGHAVAAAVTAVGIVIVLFPAGHDRWHWERWAVVWSAGIALSRTYLDAHWLSDVVAGGLLGGTLALGFPAALVLVRTRRAARAP
jgi:membrane-associated phospholipid phosphatase